MYNRITILALLFLCRQEVNAKHDLCHSMVFSDAQPVQFWAAECDTYNQHEAQGVFHKCFCQPFNCDDEIVFQFTDDSSGEVITPVSGPVTLPNLSDWLNHATGSNPDWTTGAAPEVTMPGAFPTIIQSEILYADYAFIEGYDYIITINYTNVWNSGGANPRNIYLLIMDVSYNILEQEVDAMPISPGASDSIVISFTAPANAVKIGVYGSVGSNITLTLNSTSGTYSGTVVTPGASDDFILSVRNESGFEILSLPFDPVFNVDKYVYTISLIPSEVSPEICNEIVIFYIRNDTTGTDVAKSDCININTHTPSILVTYSNHRNFAGLIYENQSPDTTFYLRIPAVFYHQRFPEEDETMELTSSLLTLNATLRKQRLLDTDYMPYYMHEKIKLVLKHQFVSIYGKEWVKQEAYEISDGNRLSPLKKAKCWISEKDFVQRNVL